MTASWVIVETATNKAICETYSMKTVAAINKAKYKAVPILEYLQKFNIEAKEQQNKEEWIRQTNKEIREGAV
jgi:hypothetical protein